MIYPAEDPKLPYFSRFLNSYNLLPLHFRGFHCFNFHSIAHSTALQESKYYSVKEFKKRLKPGAIDEKLRQNYSVKEFKKRLKLHYTHRERRRHYSVKEFKKRLKHNQYNEAHDRNYSVKEFKKRLKPRDSAVERNADCSMKVSKHPTIARGVLIDFILLQSFLHPRWNTPKIAWFCLCIC